MVKSQNNICSECREPVPHHSRVCPNCLFCDSFSTLSLCQLTPIPLLKLMRGYLSEASRMPKVGVESLFRDPCRVQMLELEATFEAVKSVLMLSFSDDDEVVEAVNIISELLSDALSQRRRATRRLRVTFGAGVAIAAVAITMAVVAVEWF